MYRIEEHELPQERWQYRASPVNQVATARSSRRSLGVWHDASIAHVQHGMNLGCGRWLRFFRTGTRSSRSQQFAKQKLVLALYSKAKIASLLIAI